MERVTAATLQQKKERNEKIVMLTAYDFPTGKILDEAGVDVILVGDSVANVVLGLDSTRDVGLPEMLHHVRAVRRGVSHAFLVADMPFAAYQVEKDQALPAARAFLQEGCDAVKVEWFADAPQVVASIVAQDIPVMGHVGLTPQTADQLGGFKVQGRDAEAAGRLLEQARCLVAAGCFSLVVECIPAPLAGLLRKRLRVPIIGIGAGPDCDGQVLVLHDVLGLFQGRRPKFVKQYADCSIQVRSAAEAFARDVRDQRFPGEEHIYAMRPEEWERLVKREQL